MPSSTSNSEPLRRQLSGRPPRGLLIAALIIAVIELVVSRVPAGSESALQHRYYPPDRLPLVEDSIVQWQLYHALATTEHQDILLMGDSSCLTGLRPLQMMATTKAKIWNFGTLGSYGTEAHKQLLELFFERHGVSPLVVYHVAWQTLVSAKHLEKTSDIARLRAWLEVLSGGDIHFPPSTRYRYAIRRVLVPDAQRQTLQHAQRGVFPSDASVRRLLKQDRGALTDPRHMPRTAGNLRSTFDERQRGPLSELFAMTAKHGFDLLVMVQPVTAALDTAANRQSAQRLTRTVQQIAAPYPRVRVTKSLVRFYANELHASENHLTEAGARRNTDALMKLLGMRPIGSRQQPDQR